MIFILVFHVECLAMRSSAFMTRPLGVSSNESILEVSISVRSFFYADGRRRSLFPTYICGEMFFLKKWL